MRSFVVKVQIPLVTNDPVPKVLIYNHDRSVLEEFVLTEEIRQVLKNRPKSFWHAHFQPDPDITGGRQLCLDRPTKARTW